MPGTQLFSILDSTDSTNNYAMAKVHAGLAKHGMAWFAREQTAGKGQRGRAWVTGNNENIALSIVLEPTWLNPSRQFEISVAVSLGCYEFFMARAGEGTSIKWPNDIYWRDRKAGGILIENVIHGNTWAFVVAGIGINVNRTSFGKELRNAVSLRQIKEGEYDCVELAAELYTAVMSRIERLKTGSFDELLENYNNVLYKRNMLAKFKKDNIVFSATVKCITSRGTLLLDNGVETEFDFGELSWVQ
jgi:BirA family biotin operon repressor/biotin-[acetyl-CoA-carboxylase] ligase